MAPTNTIRIVVADERALMRCGLAVFVKSCPDFELRGEAANSVELLELVEQHHPHVVLTDFLGTPTESIRTIAAVRQRRRDTQIIMLTDRVDELQIQSALGAGANSYLLKTVGMSELADAIRDAHAGKATLAREAAQALVNAVQNPASPPYSLTGREREVLALMMHGLNNTQIAAQLTVSISTVKKHVSNILMKLETTSRTQAVAVALRHQLATV